MRVGIFGPQLYRTTVVIKKKNLNQYFEFWKVVEEARKGIKHVNIEAYNGAYDIHVVSLTFPLTSNFHKRMMKLLHERGLNLAQLGGGGILMLIPRNKK